MTRSTAPNEAGPTHGRTTVISTVTIVGVLLVGAVAMAANLGLLHKVDDAGAVGTASAALDAKGATGTKWARQTFTVQDAGAVVLESSGQQMRVASVEPASGWTSAVTDSTDTAVGLTFTSAATSYEFRATLASDGAIEAGAAQPQIRTVVVPVPADAAGTSSSGAATASDDDSDPEHNGTTMETEEQHEGREDDD